MNKFALAFAFAFVVLLSCNTAKQLAKQQTALNSLSDKIQASKVIQIKDSVIFSAGKMQTVKDTIVIIDSVPGIRVEKYFFNTHTSKSDTIKFYERDAVRESALQNEVANYRAQYDARKEIIAARDKWLMILAIACGVLLVMFGGIS